jgi:hypothetical protein
VEEEELDPNGGVLEYTVRMPSTRSIRQRTNLAVVSIDRPERDGRVGDQEYQSGLEEATLSQW